MRDAVTQLFKVYKLRKGKRCAKSQAFLLILQAEIMEDNAYEGHPRAVRGLGKDLAKKVVKTVAKEAGKAVVKKVVKKIAG